MRRAGSAPSRMRGQLRETDAAEMGESAAALALGRTPRSLGEVPQKAADQLHVLERSAFGHFAPGVYRRIVSTSRQLSLCRRMCIVAFGAEAAIRGRAVLVDAFASRFSHPGRLLPGRAMPGRRVRRDAGAEHYFRLPP